VITPVDPNPPFDEEAYLIYNEPPIIEPHEKGEPSLREVIDQAVEKRKETGEHYVPRHRKEI
jgi:hypothetical protein